MRNAFLVCLFLMCGCAAGASLRSDLQACRGDATCVQHMQEARDAATAATKAATQDGLLPTAIGYLVSLVVGVIGGHKLPKKAV